jgi:hypothetical protein
VLEQLGPEPAEAEAVRGRLVGELDRLLVAREQRARLEALRRGGLRRPAVRLEVQELRAVALDDDRRARRLVSKEGDARELRLREARLAGTEAEGLQRFDELPQRMRRGEPLQQERRIERQTADLAQAADEPDEVIPG